MVNEDKCFSCQHQGWRHGKHYCGLHDLEIKRPTGCDLWQDRHKKHLPNEKGEYDYGY